MRKDNNIRYWFCAVIAVSLLAACSTEEVLDAQQEQDFLNLSASKIQVTTKAPTTPALEDFNPGTKYSIYGYVSGTKENLWGKGKANPRLCTETADHAIDYWTGEAGQTIDKISLGTKTAEFYGFTYGSDKKIDGTAYLTTEPNKIKIAADNTTKKVEDLMFSNNLKNCNSSQGTLQMNFKHAMSKLKFEIFKDPETNYADSKKYFLNTTLTKIEITTSRNAIFNVLNGTWSDWGTEEVTSVHFNNNPGKKLETTTKPIDGETLIIPNNAAIKVTIHLANVKSGSGTEATKILTYQIKDKNEIDPYKFLPNHQYTLTIGVLREKGAIVIAFDPLVEPWKDKAIDLGET